MSAMGRDDFFSFIGRGTRFVLFLTEEALSSGLLSLDVPNVPWNTQILADQLFQFQPGGTDYAHLITTGTPGFSDLPNALLSNKLF